MKTPRVDAAPIGGHDHRMSNDRPKRPRDPNQLARLIVGIATGEVAEEEKPEESEATKRAREAGTATPLSIRACCNVRLPPKKKPATATASSAGGSTHSLEWRNRQTRPSLKRVDT